MPNRVLKAGVNGSPRLAECSWPAECMFFRILTCTDDFGVMECTMDVLMCDAFKSRRRQVNDSKLLKWLVELVTNDLVTVYTANHKPYLSINRWTNNPKSRRRKWPPPEEACSTLQANVIVCSTLQEGSCKCLQMITNACVTETETETETVSLTETEGGNKTQTTNSTTSRRVARKSAIDSSGSGLGKRDLSDSGTRVKAARMVEDLNLNNVADRIAEKLRVSRPESHPEGSRNRKQALADLVTVSKVALHCRGDPVALETVERLACEVAEGTRIRKPVAAWIKRVKNAGLFYKSNDKLQAERSPACPA